MTHKTNVCQKTHPKTKDQKIEFLLMQCTVHSPDATGFVLEELGEKLHISKVSI